MPSLLRMPEVAANTPEATLLAWAVEENAPYASGATILSVETAKATVDVEADEAGVVLKTLVAAGTEVKVGESIALLGLPGETVDDLAKVLAELGADAAGSHNDDQVVEAPQIVGQTAASEAGAEQSARTFASPLARRLAREAGLDIDRLIGTGPNGRIIRRDVTEAIDQTDATSPAPPVAPRSVPVPTAHHALGEEPGRSAADYVDEPHTKLRRLIAARLTESKLTAPHFYLSATVEVDELLQLRTRINETAATHVSVNDMIIKAVAFAHGLVPMMNVVWTEDAIRRFNFVDVAMAIAAPTGLVTPVVRGVDGLSLSKVADTTKDNVYRASHDGFRQQELEGGSITVTNLGMYGIADFSAIINPPQAAILAVGAAAPAPVVRDGKLEVATQMKLTLSVDHRAVDGALAATWIDALRTALENPLQILI